MAERDMMKRVEAADESVDERRTRQSAREVAEWETALAAARTPDHSNGRRDVARAPRGEETITGQGVTGTNVDSKREMNYGTARDSLVTELRKDAATHERGYYDEIGRRFDGVEREMPRGAAPQLGRLRVALAFWDGWIDARDHQWLAGGNIPKAEWPMLARRIASDLSEDHDISDPRVGARFDDSAGDQTEDPVQTLAVRLPAV